MQRKAKFLRGSGTGFKMEQEGPEKANQENRERREMDRDSVGAF